MPYFAPPQEEAPIVAEQVARTLLQAAQEIIAYRVITTDDEGLGIHASSAIAAHVDQVIGVSTQAAHTGDMFSVAESGIVTNEGWNWTPGQPLFLGFDGEIAALPVGVFSLQVGYAKSPIEVYVRIGRGILRSI